MISDIDKDGSGSIDFEEFLDMMTAKMSDKDTREDINKVSMHARTVFADCLEYDCRAFALSIQPCDSACLACVSQHEIGGMQVP